MSNSVDFELVSANPFLTEYAASRMFELMAAHTHGHCHALTIYLFDHGYGTPMIVRNNGYQEVIHSFIKTSNGMSLDGGGLLPIEDMLSRYISCVNDFKIDNFKLYESSRNEIFKIFDVNSQDICLAEEFWNLALTDYGDALENYFPSRRRILTN